MGGTSMFSLRKLVDGTCKQNPRNGVFMGHLVYPWHGLGSCIVTKLVSLHGPSGISVAWTWFLYCHEACVFLWAIWHLEANRSLSWQMPYTYGRPMACQQSQVIPNVSVESALRS